MFAVVTLLTAIAAALNAAEPQCPKFHYEEQTLAKVIKLEILVQKMKEDIDSTQKQVHVLDKMMELENDKKELKVGLETEVENIKTEFKKMKEDIDSTQKQVHVLDKMMELENDKKKIKAGLETEVETLKTEFKKMKENNEADMSRHAQEVKKIADSAVKHQAVAFLAKELATITPGKGAVFVFKTTILNEGSGYDNTSGIFTIPVEGVYLFTVQLCASRNSDPRYYIVADGKYLKRGFFYDKGSGSCHTADAFAILKTGSRVWVATSNSKPLQQGSYYWNTFSGVLL